MTTTGWSGDQASMKSTLSGEQLPRVVGALSA